MTSERKFIAENIKRVLLKEYLKKKVERAGFGGIDIQRTPMGTRVTLIAERPGMIIGRKGGAIKELTDIVAKDFEFDNPQIEVQEEKNPNLNPHIMAHKLAAALERGWHFRRAGHSTVRRIMGAGAKGCQVIISGKLIGQRHRVEKFKEGHIKYCGEPARIWMKEGFAVAKKKTGIIGIKVQIMDPNAKLPDEITVKPLTVADVAKVSVKPEAKPEPEAAPEEPEPVPEAPVEEPAAAKPEPAKKEAPPKDKAPAEKPAKKVAKTRTRKLKQPEEAEEEAKAADAKPEKPEPAKSEEAPKKEEAKAEE
ncbi:MAG: 30S ribosomal protein S3, partial [Thermoplasmata archaeon]|nr:30S ribosomal protein S3 [Thermoplasmata archaeon]